MTLVKKNNSNRFFFKQKLVRYFILLLLRPVVFVASVFFVPSVYATPESSPNPNPNLNQFEAEAVNSQTQQGHIVWLDCWFDIPEDITIECGQWRTQKTASNKNDEFNVMFVVLRDESVDHKNDPLFYLSGGPGSSSYIEKENITSWYYWAEIAKLSRDIILVDQRGTGLTLPKFECKNYSDFIRTILKDNLSVKDEYAIGYEAIAACFKTVQKNGFSFSDYSTSLSAMDMNNIARALDYSQWNIMGGSYGTRLGLEWMRQNPQQIRAAILDSVYPFDKGTLEEWPETVHNAFAYFWSRCAVSITCQQTVEDKDKDGDEGKSGSGLETSIVANKLKYNQEKIEKDFWLAVEKLDKYPQTLTIPLWYGDWPITAVVNGHRFISLIYQSLYDETLQDDILTVIENINSGSVVMDTTVLKKLAADSINSELAEEFNPLTYFAIECSETPRANKLEFLRQVERFPKLKSYTQHALEFDPCNLVPRRTDLETFRSPLNSQIPSLILSGGFDPVTPSSWAKELNKHLSKGILWYLPDGGHGVVNSNVCVHQSLRAFLDEPNTFSIPSC